VCVSIALSVLSFGPKLTGTDDATYIVAARALEGGNGFAKINLQGNPPEIYYPPGFPLLLAPVVALFPHWPDYVVPLAAVPVFFGILSVVATWLLFRELGAGPNKALAIALVMATSYVGVGWYTTSTILSESCYTFFTVVALLLLQRFIRLRSWTILLLAALAIGTSYLVRTVGIALMIAAIVYFLSRKEYRPALALLLLSMAFVVPWLYRTAMIRQSEWGQYGGVFLTTYLDTFLLKNWQRVTLGRANLADYAIRLLTNLRGHTTFTILQLLFPTLTGERLVASLRTVHLGWLPGMVGLGSVALMVTGWIERLWKSRNVAEVYLFFYVLTILLPSWYTVRNLVPILPFLVYYLLAGVRWLAGRVFPSGLKIPSLLCVAMGLVIVAIVSSNLLSDRHIIEYGAAFRRSGAPYVETQPGFLEACDWIIRNTDPEALVVYRSSEKMYLCSGRQAPPELSTMPISLGARDPGEVFAAILEHADWVVVTTTERDVPLTAGEPIDYQGMPAVNRMIEADTYRFTLVYETITWPILGIYRVNRPAAFQN